MKFITKAINLLDKLICKAVPSVHMPETPFKACDCKVCDSCIDAQILKLQREIDMRNDFMHGGY